MADYEHPLVTYNCAAGLFDFVFGGEINTSRLRLPFNYAAAALNGTHPVPETIDENVHVGTRYGVFVEPYMRNLDLPVALVPDIPKPLEYPEVLKLVEHSYVNKDSVSHLPAEHQSTMEEVREFFTSLKKILPIAIISEWRIGDDMEDTNLCMHYPDVADPFAVHSYLRASAMREQLILAADDAIKVEIDENPGGEQEPPLVYEPSVRTVQIGEQSLAAMGYSLPRW